MKVLLLKIAPNYRVEKRWKIIVRKWPPLELLYISTLLKAKGIESTLFDLSLKQVSFDDLNNLLKVHDLTFISTDSVDRWQCPLPDYGFIINFINPLRYKERIYLLGPQGTVLKNFLLEKTGVRGIICGEPENLALKISLGELKGEIVENAEEELPALPIPDYEKLVYKPYFYELLGNNFALVETVRGCLFHCRFCFKIMYGKKIKRKDLAQVLEELHLLVNKLRVKNLYLIDLTFGVYKDFSSELCKEIYKRGFDFQWCCQTRIDILDPEFLQLLAKANCKIIHLGLEAYSKKTLKAMNKGFDPNKAKEILLHARRLGIKTLGFFILGYPGVTEEETYETIKYACSLPLDYVSFHPFIPYPEVILNNDLKPDKKINKIIPLATLQFYLKPSRLIAQLKRPDLLSKKVNLYFQTLK